MINISCRSNIGPFLLAFIKSLYESHIKNKVMVNFWLVGLNSSQEICNSVQPTPYVLCNSISFPICNNLLGK